VQQQKQQQQLPISGSSSAAAHLRDALPRLLARRSTTKARGAPCLPCFQSSDAFACFVSTLSPAIQDVAAAAQPKLTFVTFRTEDSEGTHLFCVEQALVTQDPNPCQLTVQGCIVKSVSASHIDCIACSKVSRSDMLQPSVCTATALHTDCNHDSSLLFDLIAFTHRAVLEVVLHVVLPTTILFQAQRQVRRDLIGGLLVRHKRLYCQAAVLHPAVCEQHRDAAS
jgi:hypothetical protein